MAVWCNKAKFRETAETIYAPRLSPEWGYNNLDGSYVWEHSTRWHGSKEILCWRSLRPQNSRCWKSGTQTQMRLIKPGDWRGTCIRQRSTMSRNQLVWWLIYDDDNCCCGRLVKYGLRNRTEIVPFIGKVTSSNIWQQWEYFHITFAPTTLELLHVVYYMLSITCWKHANDYSH